MPATSPAVAVAAAAVAAANTEAQSEHIAAAAVQRVAPAAGASPPGAGRQISKTMGVKDALSSGFFYSKAQLGSQPERQYTPTARTPPLTTAQSPPGHKWITKPRRRRTTGTRDHRQLQWRC